MRYGHVTGIYTVVRIKVTQILNFQLGITRVFEPHIQGVTEGTDQTSGVFLRSNYTDITQNTCIQSSMVTEILAREV